VARASGESQRADLRIGRAGTLGQPQEDEHAALIFDGRWRCVRCEGFRAGLFDLETDPQEVVDLWASEAAEHVAVRDRMAAALLDWARRHHTRITATPGVLARQKKAAETGILIGFWDEAEYLQATGQRFEDLKPVGKPSA